MHTYQEVNGPQNTVCATRKYYINGDKKLTFKPREKEDTLKKPNSNTSCANLGVNAAYFLAYNLILK